MILLWYFFMSLVSSQSTSDSSWSESMDCTYHDYEGDIQRMGLKAADDAPGYCGIRYSALNLARITAISTMNPGLCGQCVELRGSSRNGNSNRSVFVLAMDLKGRPGLDVTRSSFAKLFPDSNPLDPQMCQWRVVSMELCGKICYGSDMECTPGSRNLLPANVLPPLSGATPQGVDVGLPVSSNAGNSSAAAASSSSSNASANNGTTASSTPSVTSSSFSSMSSTAPGNATTAVEQQNQQKLQQAVPPTKNHAAGLMSLLSIKMTVLSSIAVACFYSL